MNFKNSKTFAQNLDEIDDLKKAKSLFLYPRVSDYKKTIYLCGNSLGLQPKSVHSYLKNELLLWENRAVLGQHERWENFHEDLAVPTSKLIGSKPSEVVIMNALTVNLHLLLVSFYKPIGNRCKILIEKGAFPSDQYAVESQIKFHGLDPRDCLIEFKTENDKNYFNDDNIVKIIQEQGSEIATILIGGVNYYNGQLLDIRRITKWGKKMGSMVGFDLAHAVGNVTLDLNKWNVDFAAWCSYKYLCAGPGSPGGVYINEKYHDWKGPRFEGWWGQNKEIRFNMGSYFDGIKTAEGWQLSNAPIFGMTPLKASMEIFDQFGMPAIRSKGIKISSFLIYLIEKNIPEVSIITPKNFQKRGCQLSLTVKDGKRIFTRVSEQGVVCDWREPNVIRVAPHPLYNSYLEVYDFVKILKNAINER
tara:strand:+ start:936 stop:2189 length:1254 start_codon:yes stop_codon:yes gene_type:complete